MLEDIKRRINNRTGAVWLGGIVLTAAAMTTLPTAFPNERTRLERERQAQAAPFCTGTTQSGLPCKRRTQHPSTRCPDHRGLLSAPRRPLVGAPAGTPKGYGMPGKG